MSFQTGEAAAFQGLLQEAQEVPVPEPSDGIVMLPGGWLDPDGQLHRKAWIRELSGADEEALSRATRKGGKFDPILYVSTVVERGLESIDGIPITPTILNSLLIGDRDYIALAIRRATYGEDFPMRMRCPRCEVESDVAVELDKDVPCRSLDDPEVWWRHVPLRGGGEAVLHLVTVTDQFVALSDERLTTVETDTIILARVVKELRGQPVLNERTFQEASAGDRRTIIKYLIDKQPGPQMGEVKGSCPACDEEIPIPLSLPAMFL